MHSTRDAFLSVRRLARLAALACIAAAAVGCAANHQETFATPDDAGAALAGALRPRDDARLHAILGDATDEIVSSGDPTADAAATREFLEAYDRKRQVVTDDDGVALLLVGDTDWPLPIPLIEEHGRWRFGAEEAKHEILARRIGRNEMNAVDVCRAIVDAQHEYAELDMGGAGAGAYAMKILSDPGSRNGLYWAPQAGWPASPLGAPVASAQAEGSTTSAASQGPTPYHGYWYRILTSQGPGAPGGAREYMNNGKLTDGFAVLAYPGAYGNSGVMTFVVSQHGVVFERDLGSGTERTAKAMTTFDPDARWRLMR